MKKNILLGVTGSVAAILTDKLYKALLEIGNVDVKIVITDKADCFIPAKVFDIPNKVLGDEDEWEWEKKGDPIIHIDLAKWADIMVIAPLTANTLAKITYGLSDNLLTSVVRAWDYEKPLILAPSMNCQMYEHVITSKQIKELYNRGCIICDPVEKTLACGDTGIGAMAHIDTIVQSVKDYING